MRIVASWGEDCASPSSSGGQSKRAWWKEGVGSARGAVTLAALESQALNTRAALSTPPFKMSSIVTVLILVLLATMAAGKRFRRQVRELSARACAKRVVVLDILPPVLPPVDVAPQSLWVSSCF